MKQLLAIFVLFIQCLAVNSQKKEEAISPQYSYSIRKQSITDISKYKKRLALVIGNADYKHAPRLKNPTNDADDIANKLKDLGFEVLLYKNLIDKESIRSKVQNFSQKLKNYDIGLFYYSGHGIQENSVNYILPVDIELRGPEEADLYCFNSNIILESMKNAQCKFKLVILDACRDNPFEDKWQVANKSWGTKKGLAEMNSSANSIIIFATAPGKQANDNPNGRNGLFTQELLKVLDNKASIQDIFMQTTKSVSDLSNATQVPWFNSSLLEHIYLKP